MLGLRRRKLLSVRYEIHRGSFLGYACVDVCCRPFTHEAMLPCMAGGPPRDSEADQRTNVEISAAGTHGQSNKEEIKESGQKVSYGQILW